MSRPCKSIETTSKHWTKEEREKRQAVENSLKGNNDKIKPPTYLNANAKKIFRFIVKEMEASNSLCNLDIYILSNCAIATDRIQEAEILLNEDILNKDALRVKNSYASDLLRYQNELCLTPQSRAKMGSLTTLVKDKDTDEALKILKGDS